MKSVRKCLLLSNSTHYGHGYLDHAEREIRGFLGGRGRVLFIPWALHDREGYTARARRRFELMGHTLESVHEAGWSLERADALFVGGGNTFRLVDALHRHALIGPIRARVDGGMPYIGSSAGSIVAGPTLKTTKDMPVIQPPSFDAIGLVPFQISPHFQDPDPWSRHMGETQEERIRQYHEENDGIVVGMREGSILIIEGTTVTLTGLSGARVFTKEHSPGEYVPGDRLDHILN